MGLYDTIAIFTKCPICRNFHTIELQTKDLGRQMYNYDAISPIWESCTFGKRFRKKLKVFKATPNDKSAAVWKNQAEHSEALAKVPRKFYHLKKIKVCGNCRFEEITKKEYVLFDAILLIKNKLLRSELKGIKIVGRLTNEGYKKNR